MARSASSYITDEEMAYLRRLFAEPAPEPAVGAWLRASVAEGAALELLQGMSAELVATDGAYRLVFQVDLARGEDGSGAELRLTYPSIIDRHGVERYARVRPQGDITLEDLHGRLREPEVRDLSASGLALAGRVERAVRPGDLLEGLRLRLPERGAVPVNARVVRAASGRRPFSQRLALQFEHMPSEARDALRGYIFSRHSAVRRGPVSMD